MSIAEWPKYERPRERLLTHGAATLSDAELLAIFFRTGIKGKSAVDISRDLLQQFGGLRQIMETNIRQFCQTPGLGIAKYVQLQASFEIVRRTMQQSLQRKNVLNNPQETYRYLTSCLHQYQREVFGCLFLDNAHRVIIFDELFHGTIHSATIYPREVIKKALAHNAAAVIFAHNHPSGIAEPSEADRKITLKLKSVLEQIDIRVLDHIIIGDGQITSLAERGWL